MKKRAGIAIIATMLMMAGCSAPASVPDSAPTPTSISSSATPDPIDELRAEYVAAGGQCARLTTRDMAVAEAAGDCDGGALLSVYSSPSGRDAAIRMLEALQETNPGPYVIAVGEDWIVNGSDAANVAGVMGGTARQIGTPAPGPDADLTTDAGICAADAELTNLELNEALAPILGYPADRNARTADQDQAIRDYKTAAFLRACPARAG